MTKKTVNSTLATPTSRRSFIAGSFAAMGLAACSSEPEPGRYTQADKDVLAAEINAELSDSGSGMYGTHRYAGYQGLAELPWFELDTQGSLQCVDDSIPMAIDAHCHLGMSVLFKPTLDLSAQTPRVKHLLDCVDEDCNFDLDVYANSNFSEEALSTLERNMMAQGLWGNPLASSQTIPNLLREMDSMRVERSIILPIKLGLPFGDDQTEVWRREIKSNSASQRLLAGFSIHPRDKDKIEQMREHAKSGFKVMKLHPPIQRFYPDDAEMMEVYQTAEELGITIFFHGGRAGIEPESSQRYAMPRHYEAAFKNFPNVNYIIGHAGARDFEAMLTLAKRYQNTWIGTHGQSLRNLETMIQQTGGERLLYGTDWPFYHIASSLAKVLITTDTLARKPIRQAILRDNAKKLFSL